MLALVVDGGTLVTAVCGVLIPAAILAGCRGVLRILSELRRVSTDLARLREDFTSHMAAEEQDRKRLRALADEDRTVFRGQIERLAELIGVRRHEQARRWGDATDTTWTDERDGHT